ncbi:hypothetical protein C8T65DRAFT_735979 [Cerioporus squamosus]|nr:hypothetical protein C8T65DRAFT_735979 [Cerioporus squamosus]
MSPDRHKAHGGSRPSPVDGERPRSRSVTPSSDRDSPRRRTQSLPPRDPDGPEDDVVDFGENEDDENSMDTTPEEDSTVRMPIQPRDVAPADEHPPTPLSESAPEPTPGPYSGDYEVRSMPLQLDSNDPWHVVTHVVADAIHDIQDLFRRARPELMEHAEATNALRAIYNPIANALNALNTELDDTFVQALQFEPRHYRTVGERSLDRFPSLPPFDSALPGQQPLATATQDTRPATTNAEPRDVDMDGVGNASPVSNLTELPPSEPPTRATTPASQTSSTTKKKKKQDKGKGKACEPSPPPTPPMPPSAQPMRKRQRADSDHSEGGPAPNPEVVQRIRERYPHWTLEQVLSISDAYAGPSRPRPSTYAAAARASPSPPPPPRSTTPGSSRASSRASSRMDAAVRRQQGKRRRIKAPRGASRRLYIRFATPPPAEARVGPLSIVSAVNRALANHPDERLRIRATSADWTMSGQLVIQFFDDIPTGNLEEVLYSLLQQLAATHNWGGTTNNSAAPTIERHTYTSQLCFRAVACVDDSGQPLDALQTAAAAFQNAPQWREAPSAG